MIFRSCTFPVVYAAVLLTQTAAATTLIDFEDALTSLGHEGDPALFYEDIGVRFSGNYSGVIQGVSNGNAGNYKLEGSNGPASLAATSIPASGESINIQFACEQTSLSFDLGAAYFNSTQTPVPLDIRVVSYLDGTPQSNAIITVEDTLKNGNGTWYPQAFSNVDSIRLSAVAGGGTWAIDSLIAMHDTPCAFDDASTFFIIPISSGAAAVIYL